MTTEKHTPEPWRIDDMCGWIIVAGDGFSLGETSPGNPEDVSQQQAEANARRIVACVNYCKGKTNAQLEDGDEAYPGIAHDFETMRQQRDELAEALRECADAINESIPEDFSRLSNAADKANAALAKLS